ncbi:MAG: hypothetical protein K6G27_02280 [Lachnospiraceae bacterium]|nr:hypothetical protein [Lachnospiraceae bacterium]
MEHKFFQKNEIPANLFPCDSKAILDWAKGTDKVIVCWWIGYTHPETITEFTRKEAFFDSFFTLLIVGVIMTMLLALINDILDLSKLEAGNMDIVPVKYNVKELISEVVNLIRIRADNKGLSLEVDADPNIPAVLMGDEIRIKQIITNLLTNAVKYTEEGTVKLSLKSEDKGEDHIKLIVSVKDTGIGIKEEVIPTLFDEFKRLDVEKNRIYAYPYSGGSRY